MSDQTKNTRDEETDAKIGDIFARACKNNEYFGNDGWYELHTPTMREEIKSLLAQTKRETIQSCIDALPDKIEIKNRYGQHIEAEAHNQAIDTAHVVLTELADNGGKIHNVL